jgi:exosortase K
VKTKICVLALAVLAMWGMKRHYADARADDLWWILGPTSRVVGAATGAAFTVEPGQGYLSRERLFLIEKSCAGINFMIAAFGMVVFARRRRIESWIGGLFVLVSSGVASYSAAVVINAVRISTAMWLAAHPDAVSIVSAPDLHRVMGITVYFGGLVLLHELAQRFDSRRGLVRRTS